VIPLVFLVLSTGVTSGGRSRHQKNIGLVRNISTSQAVVEGSSVELECRLGNIPDRAEVAWVKLKGLGEVEYLATYRKDEGVMDYEDDLAAEMEKDGDEAVWSLTMYRVTKNMAGFYQCEVLLNDEPVSSLKVLVSTTTTHQARKVEHNTKYVITKLGGNVTLDCTDFEGEDVDWTRLGESAVVKSGKLLSLIRVDKSDSGVYVCSVSGGERTMNISLLVEHLPMVTTNQSTIVQYPGNPTHLMCQVTAVPVPAVSWYRLGAEHTMVKSQGELSISIKDYKDGRMTSSLIFHNVTPASYGLYSCNASNTEGQDSVVISLAPPDSINSGYRHCGTQIQILFLLVTFNILY